MGSGVIVLPRAADDPDDSARTILEISYRAAEADEERVFASLDRVVRRFAREVAVDARRYLSLLPIATDAG
jgi:hypothetical protein